MQRIQVGLTGLAGVVLLVGLANIVVDSVRRDQGADAMAASNATTAQSNGDKPSEPLAELGVTPTAQSSDEAPVVADLQPDPNLKKPMDRPPPNGSSR